jgi:ornithine cyclodeaminase/alanine dehydrogenase-like protein (mu-crystallin family)
LKAYVSTANGTRFVVLLFNAETGTVDAVMEADWLGRIRTGAASGVGTDALARPGAIVAGVIGAGGQAQTQIEAISSVRKLDQIKVFSRTPERRQDLVEKLGGRIDAELVAVSSAREAVEGSHIVTTITNAGEPVFDGSWLEPGTHINAAGGNRSGKREIDSTAVHRSDVIATDSVEQAHIESGDLLLAEREGHQVWEKVVELGDILAAKITGRTANDQITLFKSHGVALEDVAAARWIYDRAVEEGRGERMAFGGTD